MSWAIGYDHRHERDIGYGVPAICDHPGCDEKIHRGLSYVCGGEPYGGDHGCGLYFCAAHLEFHECYDGRSPQLCERCCGGEDHFEPKPDTGEWIDWKLTDPSWEQWRQENPDFVARHGVA